MKKILLPINLDRWRSPIASLLREVAVRNPEFEFHSFSSPAEEDRERAEELWSHGHIKRITPAAVLVTRFDGVHIASVTNKNLAAVRLAKLRSFGATRFFFTANLQIDQVDPQYALFVRAVRKADQVISVSRAVADDVAERFGRKVARVIPNGFDPVFMDPALAGEPANEPEPFVLWVGTIEPRKRPDIFRQVAEKLPGVRFRMLGPMSPKLPAEDRALIERVPNLELEGGVGRERLREILGKATLLLFPSEREGLPLSVIEALGMGVPVLGQAASSMPELVVEGRNGYLRSPARIDEWARVVELEIAMEKRMRAERARTMREEACRKYSWAEVARLYAELYKENLGGVQAGK